MGQPAAIRCVESAEDASALFHPIRRKILESLDKPDSATGVARRLKLPRQKVNYHLRELENAGHVREHSLRSRGNCTERIVERVAHRYLVAPQAIGSLATFDSTEKNDCFSWAYLVATVGRALRDLTTLRSRADAIAKPLSTFTLETEVRFASPKSLHEFTERLSNEVAALVREHHDGNATSGRTYRFFISAYPAVTKSEADAKREEQEKTP